MTERERYIKITYIVSYGKLLEFVVAAEGIDGAIRVPAPSDINDRDAEIILEAENTGKMLNKIGDKEKN